MCVGLFGDLLAILSDGSFLSHGGDAVHLLTRVPDLHRTHSGVFAQALPIGTNAFQNAVPGLGGGQVNIACSQDKADRQTFAIPLPGPGQGFVEVVDVKDQVALGGGEQTEVQQMTVATGLDPDAGAGRGREVVGHECRRAPHKGKRTVQHAAIANGQELWQAALARLFEYRDGVAAVGGLQPGGMTASRHTLTQRLTFCNSLGP